MTITTTTEGRKTNRLLPRMPVPFLEVSTLDGGTWRLADQRPENFTMIVFYRGLHCPVCKAYLRDLDRRAEDFAARGVEVIALSMDTKERAQQAKQEWGLQHIAIGYGLSIAEAREWGLYISRGIKEGEPAEFAEPGLFLVRPDGTLYAAAINTMPFARPSFNELLGALDFVIKNNYPARGAA